MPDECRLSYNCMFCNNMTKYVLNIYSLLLFYYLVTLSIIDGDEKEYNCITKDPTYNKYFWNNCKDSFSMCADGK